MDTMDKDNSIDNVKGRGFPKTNGTTSMVITSTF
jgi:hypothetical protein